MTLKNITLDGKYQTFWFLLFDLVITLGGTIEFEGNLVIKNFNIDITKMRPFSGRWVFGKLLYELIQWHPVLEVHKDGTVIYKNDYTIL